MNWWYCQSQQQGVGVQPSCALCPLERGAAAFLAGCLLTPTERHCPTAAAATRALGWGAWPGELGL